MMSSLFNYAKLYYLPNTQITSNAMVIQRPPAPAGQPHGYLNQSPTFFTPFDENQFIYPANIGTYFKRPPAPTGVASWLNRLVSQPYFQPALYDPNTIVWPANEATYFKAPPIPKGMISLLSETISQPFAKKQFIPPFDENIYGTSTPNVGTYYKAPPAPKGFAGWGIIRFPSLVSLPTTPIT